MSEKLSVGEFRGTTRNRIAYYGKYDVSLEFQTRKSRKYDNVWRKKWVWRIVDQNSDKVVVEGTAVNSERALARINKWLHWKHR